MSLYHSFYIMKEYVRQLLIHCMLWQFGVLTKVLFRIFLLHKSLKANHSSKNIPCYSSANSVGKEYYVWRVKQFFCFQHLRCSCMIYLSSPWSYSTAINIFKLLYVLLSKSGYSKCEIQRAVAFEKLRCRMVGVYIPHCERDGSYSLIQCSSTGYCCCADPYSGKLSGCVKSPEKPHCPKKGIQFTAFMFSQRAFSV